MLIHYRTSSVFARLQCKGSVIILSSLWIVGLLLGSLYGLLAGDSFSSQLSIAAHMQPSVIGLSAVVLLPIAVSAIALYCHNWFPIYILSFFKAITFGCSLFALSLVYGNSGWIVRMFLQSSNSCSCLLMFWLWYRFFCLANHNAAKDLVICAAGSITIGLIDYFLVSPYLVFLMNYS